MKKFSKIQENSGKKYFEVYAEIKISFESENEGEAGYKADSIIGAIKEQVDYKIQDISEISQTEYIKLFESNKSKDGTQNI